MVKKVFFCKELNTDDRDCVKYIQDKPIGFKKAHYFGGVYLQGPCFHNSINRFNNTDYDNIITILSKEEINLLVEFDKAMEDIGYAIEVGGPRYEYGMQYCKNIMSIYDKLNSKENQELFNKVILEEKDYIRNEYNLDDSYIDEVFNKTGLDYRDRSVIAYVFDTVEEFSREKAEDFGCIPNGTARKYFDYKSFGEDLLTEEKYHKLDNNKIVEVKCINNSY